MMRFDSNIVVSPSISTGMVKLGLIAEKVSKGLFDALCTSFS